MNSDSNALRIFLELLEFVLKIISNEQYKPSVGTKQEQGNGKSGEPKNQGQKQDPLENNEPRIESFL